MTITGVVISRMNCSSMFFDFLASNECFAAKLAVERLHPDVDGG
jgi:hypothetical protein